MLRLIAIVGPSCRFQRQDMTPALLPQLGDISTQVPSATAHRWDR